MNKPNWWGYLHRCETVQVKCWCGDHNDYTTNCEDNPSVKYVVKPFYAEDHKSAKDHIKREILRAGFDYIC